MELNNKVIGRTISKFRQIRDMKAFDVAEKIGMKEGTYTKYERGETAITLDFLQKVSDALEVDPVQLLSVNPGNFIESIQNSPNAGAGNYVGGNLQVCDEKQAQIMLKLMESVVALNERLITLLDKK